MKLLKDSFRIHIPEKPVQLKSGIYHFRREAGGNCTRFHLRVEEDGSGVLLANASVAARLSHTGVLIAKARLEGVAYPVISKTIIGSECSDNRPIACVNTHSSPWPSSSQREANDSKHGTGANFLRLEQPISGVYGGRSCCSLWREHGGQLRTHVSADRYFKRMDRMRCFAI